MFPVRQAAAGSYYPGNETLVQTKGRSASAKQWRLKRPSEELRVRSPSSHPNPPTLGPVLKLQALQRRHGHGKGAGVERRRAGQPEPVRKPVSVRDHLRVHGGLTGG